MFTLIEQNFIRVFLLAAFCSTVSPRLIAQVNSANGFINLNEPGNIKIQMTNSLAQLVRIDPSSRDDVTKWQQACGRIGLSLQVGIAPWGLGAFRQYSCWIDDKHISGPKEGAVISASFSATGEYIKVDFFGPAASPGMNAKLPRSAGFFKLLDDDAYSDLVALVILDQLPYAGLVNAGVSRNVRHVKLSQKVPKFVVGIDPPANMVAFQLTATSTKPEALLAKINGDVLYNVITRTDSNAPKEIRQKFGNTLPSAKNIKSFWIQNAAGPGKLTKSLTEHLDMLRDLIDDEENKIKSLFAGALVARFGISVVTEPELLKKSKLIGVVLDSRPFGFGGLRLFFDMVPTETQIDLINEKEEKTQFGWKRFAIGWSLSAAIAKWTNGLIDTVDFTPKASIWDLVMKLRIATVDGSTRSYEFLVKNDHSFGWELGMEKTLAPFLFRVWYGADFLGWFAKLEGSTRVNMNRIGLDTWVKGPALNARQSLRTSFLLFSVIENQSFSKKSSDASDLDNVQLVSAYLGGGAGIQW